MLTKITTLLTLLCLTGMMSSLSAQQLVYRPINPAFGGDTFNYQWLIQSAEAQNRFTDPAENQALDQQSELDSFAEGLNRQYLSQLSRIILAGQVDVEGGLQPGTFTVGNLELEVLESFDGLIVNILNTSNGDQTQIFVPNN